MNQENSFIWCTLYTYGINLKTQECGLTNTFYTAENSIKTWYKIFTTETESKYQIYGWGFC
jgi:hypothetical protein